MTASFLRDVVLFGAALLCVSAELNNGKVQEFNFKTSTHYRKEYKDSDGTVHGEYGVHQPNGWTRVLRYQTGEDKILRVIQEYITPTRNGSSVSELRKLKHKSPAKLRTFPASKGALRILRKREVSIIALPQLWKVRGADLMPTDTDLHTVTLASTDSHPLVAPPALAEQSAIYNFRYAAPFHGHSETGTEAAAKFGEYYVDLPNCWRSMVRYYADEEGYHPTLRTTRTPGCLQQKRETVQPSGQAAVDGDGPPDAGATRQPDLDIQTTGAGDITAERNGTAASPPGDAVSPQERQRSPQGGWSDAAVPAACLIGNGGDERPPSRPYGFAYNVGTHYHWEKGFANGTKVGAYAVHLPDGTLRTTSYTADCTGFRPSITIELVGTSKFKRDFSSFHPPAEAQLFGGRPRPELSPSGRTGAPAAPRPNGLPQSDLRKSSPSIRAPTTTTTTTPSPATTAATPTETVSSATRPKGGRRVDRVLVPIVPLRSAGTGPYHFYVHLPRHYHEERSYLNGSVAGQYGVVGPDGILREVGYTSSHGYVPTLTDSQVGTEHDLSGRPSQL